MLKKLFLVFAVLSLVILTLFVFRFFYLKGLLRLNSNSFLSKPHPTTTSSSPLVSAGFSPQQTATPLPTQSPSTSPVPRGKLVRIDVDDTGAGMYQFSVKRGVRVKLTFNVMVLNVNYGGLEFKSPVVNTGIILPGQSKTVEFIAQDSFVLVPYYLQTGAPAPYSIKVLVEE